MRRVELEFSLSHCSRSWSRWSCCFPNPKNCCCHSAEMARPPALTPPSLLGTGKKSDCMFNMREKNKQ